MLSLLICFRGYSGNVLPDISAQLAYRDDSILIAISRPTEPFQEKICKQAMPPLFILMPLFLPACPYDLYQLLAAE